MGKIIVIANQKGGVGKTTTVINMSTSIAKRNKKVLVIDIDSQSNTSTGLNVNNNSAPTIYDILIEGAEISRAIRRTDIPNLEIIPSNQDLAGASIELVNEIAREQKLKNALEPVIDRYDFIIIDTPPSLGLLTINSFTAAHSVFIPIQCEYYALEGIAQLLKTIKLVKQNLNPDLYIEGVCLTMYDSRTNLSKEVMENIVSHFKEKTYKTIIPRNVRISEAPSHGLPVQLYAPDCQGTIAYEKLTEEFLAHN